jgi:hypothetical protein
MSSLLLLLAGVDDTFEPFPFPVPLLTSLLLTKSFTLFSRGTVDAGTEEGVDAVEFTVEFEPENKEHLGILYSQRIELFNNKIKMAEIQTREVTHENISPR